MVNPFTYFAIPLVLLLLAGARLSTLGFGRGHRVGRALLICEEFLFRGVPQTRPCLLAGAGPGWCRPLPAPS